MYHNFVYEWGVQAGDSGVISIDRATPEEAREEVIAYLKTDYNWDRIGERNVYYNGSSETPRSGADLVIRSDNWVNPLEEVRRKNLQNQ